MITHYIETLHNSRHHSDLTWPSWRWNIARQNL